MHSEAQEQTPSNVNQGKKLTLAIMIFTLMRSQNMNELSELFLLNGKSL